MGKKNKANKKPGDKEQEPLQQKRKEKKKPINKSNNDMVNGSEETAVKENSEIIDSQKKKKKKKKSKDKESEKFIENRNDNAKIESEAEVRGPTTEVSQASDGDIIPKKSKKKKRKKDKDTDGIVVEKDEENVKNTEDKNTITSYYEKQSKVRKKKNKRDRESCDIVIENKCALDENDNIPRKKKREETAESEASIVENEANCVGDHVHGKKKKKKRKHETLLDDNESPGKSLKLDAYTKGHKLETNDVDNIETKRKKKRKKEKHKEIINEKVEVKTKHRSEKDKSGDQTSANPDNQKETKVHKEKGNLTVGQWRTAEFENTERQSKFLRLLGGMKNKDMGGDKKVKKGLFGGLSALASRTGNTAMTRTEQNKWQVNMENQFEKALLCKGQKGGGLGFEKPPEEGKKFHINIQKSNSIKFDD